MNRQTIPLNGCLMESSNMLLAEFEADLRVLATFFDSPVSYLLSLLEIQSSVEVMS